MKIHFLGQGFTDISDESIGQLIIDSLEINFPIGIKKMQK